MNWYLVSYDIRSPKRLRRVHRLLKSRAHSLLESLFVFQGTAVDMEQLQCMLWKEVRAGVDDILIYRLRADRTLHRWGTACLPEGLYDFSLPALIEHRESLKWI
jgi:CRISPR/Cas system-associated endoribonuclease Cas2